MCQRHTTICPHCQKHYDEPVKIPPKKPTWADIIVAFLVCVIGGSAAGIFFASLAISAITGKPKIHYPGQSLCEITQTKGC